MGRGMDRVGNWSKLFEQFYHPFFFAINDAGSSNWVTIQPLFGNRPLLYAMTSFLEPKISFSPSPSLSFTLTFVRYRIKRKSIVSVLKLEIRWISRQRFSALPRRDIGFLSIDELIFFSLLLFIYRRLLERLHGG